MWNVGNNGYSWSSAIPTAADVGNRAYYLDFNNGGVNPNATTNRANGLQLRCLQAFIGRSVLFSPFFSERSLYGLGTGCFVPECRAVGIGGAAERTDKFSPPLYRRSQRSRYSYGSCLQRERFVVAFFPPRRTASDGSFLWYGAFRPILLSYPGYRHANYGTLYAVGNNGYSWASSVTTGTNAYNLNFNYGGINPNNNNNRANGLQLRCLQAFIGPRSSFINGKGRGEDVLREYPAVNLSQAAGRVIR
ncbi:MAG: hypothetical protein K2G93_03220 [Rikenella sp.]|nr:hypothetical protein [Rikenella sp.]